MDEMDIKEQAFQKCELFTKEEIVQSVQATIDYYKDKTNYSEAMRANVLNIWSLFLEKISKAKLPDLTEPWKFYDYYYTGPSIILYLCTGEVMGVDEDGYVDSMRIDSEYPLIKIACPYLTVKEYADMQSVTPTTVERWLKRGKLKYAKHENGAWTIPLLEENPLRGFSYTQYRLEEAAHIDIEEYPFAALSETITIHIDDSSKKFSSSFENYKNDFSESFSGSKIEMENLEYAVIKSGKAHPGPRGGFRPLLPKAYDE